MNITKINDNPQTFHDLLKLFFQVMTCVVLTHELHWTSAINSGRDIYARLQLLCMHSKIYNTITIVFSIIAQSLHLHKITLTNGSVNTIKLYYFNNPKCDWFICVKRIYE